jgi:hypothetical protein
MAASLQNTDAHTYPNIHRYPDSYSDCDAYGNTNSYPESYSDSHSYSYTGLQFDAVCEPDGIPECDTYRDPGFAAGQHLHPHARPGGQ